MQIAPNLLHAHSRFQHFPVSFFAAVMGTAGLGIALERGAQLVPLLRPLSLVMVAVAALGFLGIFALYGAKLVTHRAEVRLEFIHPVRLHFFPTISISLLLPQASLAVSGRSR